MGGEKSPISGGLPHDALSGLGVVYDSWIKCVCNSDVIMFMIAEQG